MGAEESHLAPTQVPGFNPEVNASMRKKSPMGTKKAPAKPENDYVDDTYFRHVDVTDSICPIYDDGRRDKKELDEAIEGTVELSKLLDELNIKRKDDGDSDGDLMDFPDHSSSGGDTDDDDTDDEDRGKFHHEVENEPDAVVDVYSGDAHPIAIKGDACVAETLRCSDLSDWRNQFPIYKFQWAVGSEIGNQVSFKPSRDAEAASFVIPGECVGFYIQVTATRRVENQLRGTYKEDVEGGIYDPHVQKARHADLGDAPTYTDVASTAIVGPVLLSDVWSYTILRALSEGEFQCVVKLRDEVLESNENDGVVVEGALVNKVVAAMSVNLCMSNKTFV